MTDQKTESTRLVHSTALHVRSGVRGGSDTRDPHVDHNWQLEIEGVTQGAFAKPSKG